MFKKLIDEETKKRIEKKWWPKKNRGKNNYIDHRGIEIAEIEKLKGNTEKINDEVENKNKEKTDPLPTEEKIKVEEEKKKETLTKKKIMEKITISKVTKKPFKSSTGGEMIDYFWYRGLRVKDGVTIEFGSTIEHLEDDTIEVELEKTELTNGKFRYKEVAVR